MPRMMIQFLWDAETGAREIFVDFFSDTDRTAHEHEQDHRALVDQILANGTFAQAQRHQVALNRNEVLMPLGYGGG